LILTEMAPTKVETAPSRRQVTEKDCRKSALMGGATALGWVVLIFTPSQTMQKVYYGLMGLMSVAQFCTAIEQLRRIRRGEVIEVLIPVKPRKSDVVAYFTVGALAVLVLVASMLLVPHLGRQWTLLMSVVVSTLVCLPLLHLKMKFVRRDARERAAGKLSTGGGVAPAVEGPPRSGHWWTQNSVREEVTQRVGAGQSDER